MTLEECEHKRMKEHNTSILKPPPFSMTSARDAFVCAKLFPVEDINPS